MSSNSTLGKMLDHVLPPMPPFLDMITAQAETLVNSMAAAVLCLSEPGQQSVLALSALEEQARKERMHHLDKLNNSYSTPIDRADLLQAINSLAKPVGSILLLVEEMQALKITSDNYCLEMVIVLRETASALHRGYAKLATTPGLAQADAMTGMQCLSSVDRVYRKALGHLFTIDEDLKNMQARQGEAKIDAFIHVVDMLKRRESYRHLRNVASSMQEAASVLHAIVVQIG
ncbi:MAG: hypothetical protein HQM03_00840 [Magnetococcales bacterium]|nr:hypothetical protein [Magnetococcales bacterium]